MERRYDIDWLRVIAIGLLLIYHIVIGFQPWGALIQFIQSDQSLEELWKPMSLINIWRIPFLFFVSGMGVYFALRKRNWQALLLERTKRILLPFVFGILVIVPLHVLLWADYYHQDYAFVFNPAHLWFLGNIFSYVLFSLPVLYWLFNNQDKLQKWLAPTLNHPVKVLLIAVPLIIEVTLVAPDQYEMYALTWHGYFLGMISFLGGFMIMLSGPAFWGVVQKWRWMYLGLAFALYLFRLLHYDLVAPGYLMAFETSIWILAIFGIGKKYLNKSGKALDYLSAAAYPIYIVHMIWIYLCSYFFFPLDMSPWHQLIIVTIWTFGGSFVTYHFLIRPYDFVRPFFGMKTKGQRKSKTVATQLN
jgi:glucan biosynthesis protein C